MGGYARAIDEARADARRWRAGRRGRRSLARGTGVRRRAREPRSRRARRRSPADDRAGGPRPDDRPQPPEARRRAGARLSRAAARRPPRPWPRGPGCRTTEWHVLLAERRPRAGRVDEARLRGPDARDRGGRDGARSSSRRSSSWPTTSRSSTTSTSARASRPRAADWASPGSSRSTPIPASSTRSPRLVDARWRRLSRQLGSGDERAAQHLGLTDWSRSPRTTCCETATLRPLGRLRRPLPRGVAGSRD